MTEPQVWTLIGVFTAALVGVITIVMTSFMHALKTSFGSLEVQLNARFEAVGKRLDGIDDRLDRLENRMDRLENRVDRLGDEMRTGFTDVERDISYLYRRQVGEPPAS